MGEGCADSHHLPVQHRSCFLVFLQMEFCHYLRARRCASHRALVWTRAGSSRPARGAARMCTSGWKREV